jgi:hypothetical protein
MGVRPCGRTSAALLLGSRRGADRNVCLVSFFFYLVAHSRPEEEEEERREEEEEEEEFFNHCL